jgi:oxalate decarboxylase/phosphoglucose isomerase-like protein (cupin superfamily)
MMERMARFFGRKKTVQRLENEEHGSEAHSFVRDGFLDPIPLFTQAQCDLILRHFRYGDLIPPMDWYKGAAASDRFVYDLTTRPALLDHVKLLLGDDVILWGAIVIQREPGYVHPWHVDIESSATDGRFLSVWIGLENTCKESSLQLITRSHTFGKTIQQVVHEHGLKRGQASNNDALKWAREYDPHAAFVQPDIKDGQAILFDGKLWHASNNTRREGTRTALLLQYASADAVIFQPDFDYLEWPFRLTEKHAPSQLVSGDGSKARRLVPVPPADPDIKPIQIYADSHSLPFPEDKENRWRPYNFFRGSTPVVDIMNCHLSVLSVGHSPHLPHVHLEEELLIVLEGEAEIVLNDRPALEGARIRRLPAGSFVYHPAYQYHTIQNASNAPVTYLMFKWRAAPAEIEEPLRSQFFEVGELAPTIEQEPFKMRILFEHPTSYLGKLHAHVTNLQPGGGYAPHDDEYDVAIVILAGRVETVGRVIEPLGVVFYAAGEPHGMKNIGDVPARYLVFEFHAPQRN